MIPSKVLAEEVLLLRKHNAEFVLTNLKTLGTSSFIIIKIKMLYLWKDESDKIF